MGRLGELYANANTEEKKIILSSTFSKKITFQNDKVRTPEVNKSLKLIYLINSDLCSKNKGTNPSKSDLCRQVELAVKKSNSFEEDLELLGRLSKFL